MQGTGTTGLETRDAAIDAYVGVIPRWEWRAFDQAQLGAQLHRFAASPVGAARVETYILSSSSPHSVKIRDERLDIKRLERTDDDGLELWRPMLTTPFPIDASAIRDACDAWGIPAPVVIARSSSMPSLLAEVVAATACLRAVTVRKRRTLLHVLDCHGEHVELDIEGNHWESVAFEDAAPDRVLVALKHLGFDSRRNANYPAALKRIVGFPAPALDAAQEVV